MNKTIRFFFQKWVLFIAHTSIANLANLRAIRTYITSYFYDHGVIFAVLQFTFVQTSLQKLSFNRI